MASNKFEILEDLLEETMNNQTKGKQWDQIPQEIDGSITQMKGDTIKGKQQEEEWEIGEEAEDMDIIYMDLEGIEQACVDVGKDYVP